MTTLRVRDARPWGFVVRATAVTACVAVVALVILVGSPDRGSSSIATATTAAAPEPDTIPTPATDSAPSLRRLSAAAQPLADASIQDTEPLPVRPARPGTERSFHALFLEHARRDPSGFRQHVQEVLGSAGPLAEKVAALRVCWEAGEPARTEAWRRALGGAVRAEVRSFAISFLVRKSPTERGARDVLVELIAARPDDVRERCVALCSVLRHGTGPEVMRCAAFLDTETDGGVLSGAAEALADNGTSAAQWLLAELRRPALREEGQRPR